MANDGMDESVVRMRISEEERMEEETRLPEGMILGENLCPAFISNDSKAIDLFFNVVPGIEVARLEELLGAAWAEDPLTCLKIIFNMGNVRKDGGGKQDRTNFYRSLLWLWRCQHPAHLLANIRLVHQHASLKCLLNVFMYLVHLEEEEGEYSLDGQLDAAKHHKEVKKSIRSRFVKKQRREKRVERRAAHWAAFAASLETTVDELRIKRPLEEITPKSGKEAIKEAMLKDPRVATKWRSEEIATKFAVFCKAKDAELARQQKEAKQKARTNTRAVVQQRRSDKYISQLYAAVVDIFCQGLQQEYNQMLKSEALKGGDGNSEATAKGSVGGLFAKWAPHVGGLHDKATGIARSIIKQLLPQLNLLPSTETLTREQKQRAKQRYQRDVLSRIRRAAQVPEHYVGRAQWAEVNYNRMASRCRLLWGTKVFRKHDEVRYDAYLQTSAVSQLTDKAAKGGVKTGALLPHEVTKTAVNLEGEVEAGAKDPTTAAYLAKSLELNLQWWGIVRACREARAGGGSGLGNCLPMCDVSGSMSGIPMEVSVALSILLAESMPRNSPLFGKIMTFHESPELCSLQNIPDYDEDVESSAAAAVVAAADDDDTAKPDQTRQLLDRLGNIGRRAREVIGYNWGGNTNIEAAYDLLLRLAGEHSLDATYIKQTCLVIFSDMEFDEARGSNCAWDTMHEHIRQKFAAAGYPDLPRIVYWNLRASVSQPIKEQDKEGVVLLAGFSAGLLRSFLSGQLEEFSPVKQLMKVLTGPLYDQLVVPVITET